MGYNKPGNQGKGVYGSTGGRAPNDGKTKDKCPKCGRPFANATAVGRHLNETGFSRCKG